MGFILQQFERRSSLANPQQYLVDFFKRGYENFSGMDVNEESAQRFIAVSACIDRIAKTMAMLPFPLYKRGENDSRKKALDHPLYYLLQNAPNREMTAYIWRYIQTKAYLVHGVCYSRIECDQASGSIIGLWPIPPRNVKPQRNKTTKELEYEVWNDDGSAYTIIKDNDMFRIFFYTDDGISPKSPIRLHAESIGVSLALDAFSGTFFGNGTHLGGVLQLPPGATMDPASESYKALRKSWNEVYVGIKNSNKTAILEDGMTYKELGVSMAEAQFLESKNYQIEDICRIYDMPLHRIQSYKQGISAGNMEQLGLEFLQFTILPHAMNWKQSVSFRLLSRAEEKKYYAEHDFNALMMADTAAKTAFYHQMRQDGVFTANMILKKENENPLPGDQGDALVMNANMIPVDLAADFWKSRIENARTLGAKNGATPNENKNPQGV